VVSTASADSLSLSFKDCGAKHAVTKDVQPTTLELGADTAITGTGSLDKEVSGGTYDMELKAGGGLIDSHFTGNNCEAKDFTLPLGLGTLSWDGISCPLAAADSVAINFHTKLAASLPAALATSDIHLAANDQDGESVLCVDLHLAKQESAELGCKGTADPAGPACYEGSAGALGLTETVKAQLLEVGAGEGKLEFTGSGIEGFTCSEKTYTKSGSDVTLSDLSERLYRSLTCVIPFSLPAPYKPLPVNRLLRVQCGPYGDNVPPTRLKPSRQRKTNVVLAPQADFGRPSMVSPK